MLLYYVEKSIQANIAYIKRKQHEIDISTFLPVVKILVFE